MKHHAKSKKLKAFKRQLLGSKKSSKIYELKLKLLSESSESISVHQILKGYAMVSGQ